MKRLSLVPTVDVEIKPSAHSRCGDQAIVNIQHTKKLSTSANLEANQFKDLLV